MAFLSIIFQDTAVVRVKEYMCNDKLESWYRMLVMEDYSLFEPLSKSGEPTKFRCLGVAPVGMQPYKLGFKPHSTSFYIVRR